VLYSLLRRAPRPAFSLQPSANASSSAPASGGRGSFRFGLEKGTPREVIRPLRGLCRLDLLRGWKQHRSGLRRWLRAPRRNLRAAPLPLESGRDSLEQLELLRKREPVYGRAERGALDTPLHIAELGRSLQPPHAAVPLAALREPSIPLAALNPKDPERGTDLVCTPPRNQIALKFLGKTCSPHRRARARPRPFRRVSASLSLARLRRRPSVARLGSSHVRLLRTCSARKGGVGRTRSASFGRSGVRFAHPPTMGGTVCLRRSNWLSHRRRAESARTYPQPEIRPRGL